MENPEHKMIFEFEGTRNLNIDPVIVPNLNGDKYDYFVDGVHYSSINTSFRLKLNGSTGTDYRQYSMIGYGVNPFSSVADNAATSTLCALMDVSSSEVGVFRALISGDSSDERYIDSLYGGSSAAFSGVTEVNKGSQYYKDSVVPIQSMLFQTTTSADSDLTLRIYQIPKTVNLENYELISEYDSSGLVGGNMVFSGLNGDQDEEYLLVGTGIGSPRQVAINGDFTTLRTVQRLLNSNGTIASANNQLALDGYLNEGAMRIFAKSGQERLTLTSMGHIAQYQQQENAGWYGDEISNVESIVVASALNIECKVSLYRRHSNKTIDPVPMVTVAEIIVDNEDISAGYTISGINGDSIDGTIKVEMDGDGANGGVFTVVINNNSSSVYERQNLDATSSIVSATPSTRSNLIFGVDNNTTSVATMYIYPKSGQDRPVLSTIWSSYNQLQFNYQVYGEEVTEISELLVSAGSSNPFTGRIRISVPKISQATCGEFTVTKN